MPIDAAQFRATLALRAASVAIVTARDGERVHGMTVSDFAGVSLNPPLILVCADKKSNTLPVIEAGRNFAVNVLAAGQEALSNRFASKEDEWRRFEGLTCAPSAAAAFATRCAGTLCVGGPSVLSPTRNTGASGSPAGRSHDCV